MPNPNDDSSRTPGTPQSGSVRAHAAGRGWTHPLLTNERKEWMKRYRTEISASCASLTSTASAFPLDTIKSRMQSYKFNNVADCVRQTYKTEGRQGFYRGIGAPLLSITLVRTISFSIYQKAKYTYDDWIFKATGNSPLLHANTPNALPSLSTFACFGAAGATSGALVTFISCPFELTKLNAQIAVLLNSGTGTGCNSFDADHGRVEGKPVPIQKQMGTIGTARMIINRHGLMGMYSGFHLHMVRDIIGTTIYFTSYESSKQLLANARGNSPTSPLPVVVAGAICGLMSWLVIYPIDSAKSIYQRNILDAKPANQAERAAIKVPKIEFFNRRMYRGLGVSIGRSMLINAVFFSVFEGMKKQINWLEFDGEDIE